MKSENELHQQMSGIDPTQWGLYEELSSDKYNGFSVKENLAKIYDIGEHIITYVDGGKNITFQCRKMVDRFCHLQTLSNIH